MSINAQYTCAFTGPRPHKLPGLDLPALRAALDSAIRRAYAGGCRVFLSGAAQGVDIWAGEAVCGLRDELPDIRLHLYLPYAGQADRWTPDWRQRHQSLLEQADEVVLLRQDYARGCLFVRNRVMVQKSGRLIAVFNGDTDSGTSYTVACGIALGLALDFIDPLDFSL